LPYVQISIIAGLLIAGIASAGIWFCGWEQEEHRTEYPFNIHGDEITAKFVFVGFREDPVDTLLFQDIHQALVDTIVWYIENHSRHKLEFSSETGILFKPGFSGFSSQQDSADTWMADLSAMSYRNKTDQDNSIPPSYFQLWTPLVSTWWCEGACATGSATHLFAEILYKIKSEYQNAAPAVPNPFENGVDALFFVFMSNDSPYDDDVGGMPYVRVDAVAVNYDTSFYSGLARHGNFFQGSGQEINVEDEVVYETLDIGEAAGGITHELVHTLGPGDGPPALQTVDSTSPEWYLYGNLNIMCQSRPSRVGLPPIGLGWLAEMPWYTANGSLIDFTGENLYGQTVYDLRDSRGKIYKFSLGEHPCGLEEYFLFGYHGENVIDQQGDGVDSVVASQGLEIWHCLGNRVFDIESALGKWDYPGAGLDTFLLPGGIPGLQPDFSAGFDNYDYWPMSSGEFRDHEEYETHQGTPFDFFRTDLTGPDAVYNNPEFSYRSQSNPRSFGYTHDIQGALPSRTWPQDEPSSLMVRIGPMDSDSVMVDFLSAPDGTANLDFSQCTAPGIVIPRLMETLEVQLETEFPDEISGVDIVLSRNAGWSFPDTLEHSFPIGDGDTIFAWTPDEGEHIADGMIKAVFRNPYSEHVYVASFPDTFTVAGTIVEDEIEDLVSPAGGENFHVSGGVEIKWTDYWEDTIASVDIYLTTNGTVWNRIHDAVPRAEYFQGPGQYNRFVAAVHSGDISSLAKVRLEFRDSGGAVATGVESHEFRIMPTLEAVFSDVTDNSQVSYEGTPYSAISIDAGGNGDATPDLLVSLQEGVQSYHFANQNIGGGVLEFADESFYGFVDNQPPPLGTGVVSADFNRDGFDDFFLCSIKNPGLYRFSSSSNKFENLPPDSFLTVPGDIAYMDSSFCASWFDYDRNGLLDLYVGCMSPHPENPEPSDDALFRQTESGKFERVTNSGLTSHRGTTFTVVCGDVLGSDGLYEVIVGDWTSGGTRLYRQQEDNTFIWDESNLPTLTGKVVGLRWCDTNRDNTLDLLVIRSGGDSSIYINNGNSFTLASSIPKISSTATTDIAPVDYDLDGWPDLVGSYVKTVYNDEPPTMSLDFNLGGFDGFGSNVFVRTTNALGLNTNSEDVWGQLLCDFNNDGSPDVFTGRVDDGILDEGLVYKNTYREQVSSSNKWVKVKLVPRDGLNTAVGAKVILEDNVGNPLGARIIDGGSGRGSQMPNVLTFGLGDYDDQLQVFVYWPTHPHEPQLTLVNPYGQSPHFGELVVIEENPDLEVLSDSISFGIESVPQTNLVNWVFTWKTNTLTAHSEDQVEISSLIGCGSIPPVLKSGVTGVVIFEPQFKATSNPASTYFLHRVEYRSVQCNVGCRFNYRVKSCSQPSECTGTEVPLKAASIKLCPVYH
jgi:hypothetical protein